MRRRPRLRDAGNGLVVDGFDVGFGSGSGNLTLTVHDWGTGFAPFVVSANQASTLPTTLSAQGGVVDLVSGQGAPAGLGGSALVAVTQTWPAIPIPYLVDGLAPGSGGGVEIEGAGNSAATLTIASPNTLEFKSGGSINVDPNGTAQGALIAQSPSSSSPITFTSSLASPAAGAWGGILFNAPSNGGSALQTSRLQGVVIDWAGDGTLTLGSDTTVVSIAAGASASGPVISGCNIENYPATACAITYSGTFVTPPSPGYAAPNNTFGGQNAVCAL